MKGRWLPVKALLCIGMLCACAGNTQQDPATTSASSMEESEEEKLYMDTFAIDINGHKLQAVLEDNKSAAAFVSLLEQAPVEVLMEDYGGFEKVGSLPVSLVQSDGAITTCPGM